MHKDLLKIHEHMQLFGRSSLAHALTLLITPTNDSDYGYYQSELAVLMAAHAAEILLKSRIAEEHPLLIFSKIPTSNKRDLLDIEALFETGRTIQYFDVPERLWAATGYKLKNQNLYFNFGNLRNNVQHFIRSKSKLYLKRATLEFVFNVVDPFLQDFWSGYAITCFEHPEYSDEYRNLIRTLFFWEIDFTYPKDYENMVQEVKKVTQTWTHRGNDVLAKEEQVKKETAKLYAEHNVKMYPEVWSTKNIDENH